MKRKDKGLTLHPEHGANPTLAVCMWCEKPTGDVVLLGNAYKGQAPQYSIVGSTPCPECAGRMAKGITLSEVAGPTNARTGRWVVTSEETLRCLIDVNRPNGAALLADVLKSRCAAVSEEVFALLVPTDDASPE